MDWQKIILFSILLLSAILNVWMIGHFGVIQRARKKYQKRGKAGRPSRESYLVEPGHVVAFYLIGKELNSIPASTKKSGTELPEHLMIKPGWYEFSGKTYDLTRQGLYRFVIPGRTNVQRIVFDGNLDALLSSICWIVTHGVSDDERSNDELSKRALNGKLLLTCTNVSRWAQCLLSSKGFRSRLVAGITLEPWNTFDDGHTMLEVYREDFGKWVLYDLDYNSFFQDPKSSAPLSFVELCDAVVSDRYDIVLLALAFRSDLSNYESASGFNYSFLAEAVRTNVRQWYRRVLQVPMIKDVDSDEYLFMNAECREKIEAYADVYRYIPEQEFLSRFYPEKSLGKS